MLETRHFAYLIVDDMDYSVRSGSLIITCPQYIKTLVIRIDFRHFKIMLDFLTFVITYIYKILGFKICMSTNFSKSFCCTMTF